MGLSFRPGDAQWDHAGYAMFRRRLAALDGIELDQMRGFGGTIDWEERPTALEPLLNSSDVHGFISGYQCERMLPRLRVILAQWQRELEAGGVTGPTDTAGWHALDPEDARQRYDTSGLDTLITGMEHGAKHGCALTCG